MPDDKDTGLGRQRKRPARETRPDSEHRTEETDRRCGAVCGDYYFVFYSERLDKFWIMTSEEFIAESSQDIKGENAGKRSILLNGKKKNRETGEYEEYPKPRFKKYLAPDFSRLSEA